MSALADRLDADLRDALRARDEVRLGTIRMLKSALLERAKSGAGDLDEAAAMAVVQKQARQRRDAIAQFEAAGRAELAARERAELAVVEAYLPEQASDDAIVAVLREAIARTGVASPREAGRVTGEAMRSLKGQADGGRVRALAQALLEQASSGQASSGQASSGQASEGGSGHREGTAA
ncbi:MAG: GatB/YqeY domain-containing protein [Rubricoccaceae bacterium]